jgi:hypothetical protein
MKKNFRYKLKDSTKEAFCLEEVTTFTQGKAFVMEPISPIGPVFLLTKSQSENWYKEGAVSFKKKST